MIAFGQTLGADGIRGGAAEEGVVQALACGRGRHDDIEPLRIEAKGVAEPQVDGQTDKLWVRFDNWFSRLAPGLTKGEYWVLYLDDDYQNALVGHPNRKYLWLLSRSPSVSAQTRELLLGEAQSRGYDTDRLIWRSSNQQIEP